VLIDAPCSGLGTLKRQPDLKWRLTEPSLEKTRRLQRRLLDHYPEVVKAGGRFVYATCSVLPSENEGQVSALLERDPRWKLECQETFSPAATGHDGLFGARLVRR
jgi:16S rRNA (cytosine967-C5)-methyltransferase